MVLVHPAGSEAHNNRALHKVRLEDNTVSNTLSSMRITRLVKTQCQMNMKHITAIFSQSLLKKSGHTKINKSTHGVILQESRPHVEAARVHKCFNVALNSHGLEIGTTRCDVLFQRRLPVHSAQLLATRTLHSEMHCKRVWFKKGDTRTRGMVESCIDKTYRTITHCVDG